MEIDVSEENLFVKSKYTKIEYRVLAIKISDYTNEIKKVLIFNFNGLEWWNIDRFHHIYKKHFCKKRICKRCKYCMKGE